VLFLSTIHLPIAGDSLIKGSAPNHPNWRNCGNLLVKRTIYIMSNIVIMPEIV
jgi:hypothetical protein